MSNIIRREAIETTVMEPYGDADGYHEVEAKKFAWRCEDCGLVWPLRHQAEACESRGHIRSYEQMYCRGIENGKPINPVYYPRYSLRRERVNGEAFRAAEAAYRGRTGQAPVETPASPVVPTPEPEPITLPRGIFTVVRQDGSYRTYRITKPAWGDFTDGRLAISLLTGPDNETAYRGVGFLFADGRVAPWKSFQGFAGDLRADIGVLLDPESAHEAGRSYARESGRCYRCNRTLTTPESLEAGIGPICADKETL